MRLAEQFTIGRDIHAIQHFGENLIEIITSGEVIVAERRSHYGRMIDALWEDKRDLVFERKVLSRGGRRGAKQS